MKKSELRQLIREEISKVLNEGFTDMFSKSEPSETFEGNSKEEFIKWARSVFKKRNVPSKKYEYWLSNVDSLPGWDNSYKGVSQDELINVHFKAWFK